MTTLIHTLGGPDSHVEIFQKAAVDFWAKVRAYNEKRWGIKIKSPKEIIIIVLNESTHLEELNTPARFEITTLSVLFSRFTGLIYRDRRNFCLFFQEEAITSAQRIYKIGFEETAQIAVVEELNHLWECLSDMHKGNSRGLRHETYEERVRYYASQDHEFRALSCAVSLTGQGRKLLKDVIAWRKKHGRKI